MPPVTRQIVRRENTQHVRDDLLVDGEQLRDADGTWMAQTHPAPVTQWAVTLAWPSVPLALTADRTQIRSGRAR